MRTTFFILCLYSNVDYWGNWMVVPIYQLTYSNRYPNGFFLTWPMGHFHKHRSDHSYCYKRYTLYMATDIFLLTGGSRLGLRSDGPRSPFSLHLYYRITCRNICDPWRGTILLRRYEAYRHGIIIGRKAAVSSTWRESAEKLSQLSKHLDNQRFA